MQVILLDKVANLGSLGDQVNVKAGYARNFLVPQGKAVPATKKNIEFFEARRAELEAKLAEVLAAANARAEKINALETVTIASKAGDEGTKKLTFTTNTPLLHAHLCPMFPPHRGINHQ